MSSKLSAFARGASLGKWSKETAQSVDVESVGWRAGWNTGGEGTVTERCCKAVAEDEEEKYEMRAIHKDGDQ
jgi:hypothetical protein